MGVASLSIISYSSVILVYRDEHMQATTITQSIPLQQDADGAWRISGTRIPVDTVIKAYMNGENAEDIIESFDTLRLADIYAILGYYLDQPAEMMAYLQRRDEEAAQIRRRVETEFPPDGLRQRLLTRRRRMLKFAVDEK